MYTIIKLIAGTIELILGIIISIVIIPISILEAIVRLIFKRPL